MHEPKPYDNPRVVGRADPSKGKVLWAPAQSVFTFVMYGGAVAALFHVTPGAILLFLVTSFLTLCFGHSLGMHRRLIHASYDCPDKLEMALVYLGTLVGMGGPFTMTRTHDLRDWAQRQNACHDFFGHRQPIYRDWWWQMHCRIELAEPPEIRCDATVANNRCYRWLDATARWQQLPWALLFYLVGGLPWLLWGVCARVAVSLTGHWLVGYFAHNSGGRHFHIAGAAVQGFDVRGCGLITFGECWHNNHHAYPGSARLGLFPGQTDPGWWILQWSARRGWVWDIKLPRDLPLRPELLPASSAEISDNYCAANTAGAG